MNLAERGQDDSVDPVIIVPGTPELNVIFVYHYL